MYIFLLLIISFCIVFLIYSKIFTYHTYSSFYDIDTKVLKRRFKEEKLYINLPSLVFKKKRLLFIKDFPSLSNKDEEIISVRDFPLIWKKIGNFSLRTKFLSFEKGKEKFVLVKKDDWMIFKMDKNIYR